MGLFDRMRSVAPSPNDPFADRVADLIARHGGKGGVAWDTAAKIAAEALRFSITQAQLDRSLSAWLLEYDASPLRRNLGASITQVTQTALRKRISNAEALGSTIVAACFGALKDKTSLSQREVTNLIGTAYGVALELQTLDPPLAAELAAGDRQRRPHAASDQPSPLELEVFKRLVRYGITSDATIGAEARSLYERAVVEEHPSARTRILLSLVELVEERKVGSVALKVFIEREAAMHLVSTATVHVAAVWDGVDADPVVGVRALMAAARAYADRGNVDRAVAILSGLLVLGDRRVVDLIGPCWQWLPPDGKAALAKHKATILYAPVVEWLLDWLEEFEGGELGDVAAALYRAGVAAEATGVREVSRALPVWERKKEVIKLLRTWTKEEFAAEIRPRLLQVAADEPAPRVMQRVLNAWGIDHTMRACAGVAMRGAGAIGQARDLIALIPSGAQRPGRLVPSVALEDSDFLSVDGALLLSWTIFNPFGPTWTCLGLLPTSDPLMDLVFLRVLNPFSQSSFGVGLFRRDDATEGDALLHLLDRILGRDDLVDGDGGRIPLFGSSIPDLVERHWDDPAFEGVIEKALFEGLRRSDADLAQATALIREFPGDPWERATAQFEAGLKGDHQDQRGKHAQASRVTPDGVRKWLSLIHTDKHRVSQLFHFPDAWHGAIDNVGDELATDAYTFWQLDDFLFRYGFEAFRQIAVERTRRSQ